MARRRLRAAGCGACIAVGRRAHTGRAVLDRTRRLLSAGVRFPQTGSYAVHRRPTWTLRNINCLRAQRSRLEQTHC